MISILIKIGVGVSLGVNLFIFAALLYNLKMYDKRVEENRNWLTEQIKQEVHQKVILMMPPTTGKVNVRNK